MKGASHVVIGLTGLALLEASASSLSLLHLSPVLVAGHACTQCAIAVDAIVGTGVQIKAIPLLLSMGVAGIVGSLLPDIDHPNATIRGWLGLASHQTAWEVARRWGRAVGRRGLGWLAAVLLWLPVALYQLHVKTTLDVTLEHRGPTHTLWAIIGVWLLSRLSPWPGVGLAFTLGYALHIAADMLTRSGVPLFWPLFRRAFGLLPKFLRFETGSLWEWLVVLGFVTLTLWRWALLLGVRR